MLATTLALVLATLAAAQNPCQPSSSSSAPPTTSSPPPPPAGIALHPNGDATKCLDVRGANFANGTPVQIYDCNGTGAQKWVLKKGAGHVQVAGTNFCLDAGLNPANGVGMKIWQCYDNVPQQNWYWTGDDRVALTNQGFCLDLPNGSKTNGNQVQIWQCATGNNNQVWSTVSNARRSRIFRE